MTISPWRMNLQPATYNGVLFFVEVDSKHGGRRKHLHEFPKKDIPYLEDLGRRAKHFTVVGYVIGPNYEDMRDALIAQLESGSDGRLQHPTYKSVDQVGIENYTVIERRERGGYAEFEMSFVELGADSNALVQPDTQGAVNSSANDAVGPSSAAVANSLLPTDPTMYSAAQLGHSVAAAILSASPGAFMRSLDIVSLNPAPPDWG